MDPQPGGGRRRVVSIDAVRGLAVVGMLLVNDAGIPAAMPAPLRHAGWSGLTLADQVFPLFLFTVGASLSFSRRAHRPAAVLRRVLALVAIGSALVSLKHHHLGASTGVLQQIAGAYLVAWLLLRLPRRLQLPAAAALLGAVWAGFVLAAGGADPWAPGHNLAATVDGAVLGQFSEHGVLVMVSSGASVVGGAVAGRLLRRAPDAPATTVRLLAGGAATLLLGLLVATAVPLSKPLWTPSFVLVTSGISALVAGVANRLLDRGRRRRLARPLEVLGGNALLVYAGSVAVFAAALKGWQPALVRPLQALGGDAFAALAYAAATVLAAWALAAWLDRRRIFVTV
jgi:predicted acyltransferase